MKRYQAATKLAARFKITQKEAYELLHYVETHLGMRRVEHAPSGCCHALWERCSCVSSWKFGFLGEQTRNYIGTI